MYTAFVSNDSWQSDYYNVCTAASFTLLKWWKELKKIHCFSCIDLSSWFVIPILIIDKA